MNFDLENWLNELALKLKAAFGDRLLFAGLAGSTARGEAGPQSDIDIHIVLDTLSLDDLGTYRGIVKSMPHSEKACGFICGKSDIAAWPVGELFQFSMGCRPLAGSLNGLFAFPGDDDIRAHIVLMASAIYHEAAHLYVFGPEKDGDALIGVYKAAFFVLQEWVYVEDRRYIPTKKELLACLRGVNKAVLETLICWDSLAENRKQDPDAYFGRIIRFARSMMLI